MKRTKPKPQKQEELFDTSPVVVPFEKLDKIRNLNPEFKWVPVTKYLPPLVQGANYSFTVIATNEILVAESFYVLHDGKVTWYMNNPNYEYRDFVTEVLRLKGKWKDIAFRHKHESNKIVMKDVTHWALLPLPKGSPLSKQIGKGQYLEVK